MVKPIIEIHNVGKQYQIGAEREKYLSLRDQIARRFTRNGHSKGRTKSFWALRDINLEVQRGEAVGVIGGNGAGKSTLLKVLSQITPPTTGRIKMRGRAASLLEVGTGFHPELTGRENVYLNGAILGMRHSEVARRFDEIVAFAEVEQFLDTPVKRYSSGMYVRLAFAVAAHLEPEILVVDEVLAVGDAQFQKKCLGKMSDVSSGGRTVLFVSHNMGAIERLCSRCVVMQGGRVGFDGNTVEGIQRYLREIAQGMSNLGEMDRRAGDGRARIRRVHCPQFLQSGECLEIALDVEVRKPIKSPDFRLGLYPLGGNCLVNFGSAFTAQEMEPLTADARVTMRTAAMPLNLGSYTINLSISERPPSRAMVDRVENGASFEVVSGDPLESGVLPPIGPIVIPHTWTIETSR